MTAKIFIIALMVESIVLHEIAHGYVALLFRDHTPNVKVALRSTSDE